MGGQSFFRRSLLQEMDSIDELLWPMYHEDIELSYRAWKNGYRIVSTLRNPSVTISGTDKPSGLHLHAVAGQFLVDKMSF